MAAKDKTVILTLVPLKSDVPLANRVRSLLKRALRDYRLRCTHIGGDALTEEKSDGGIDNDVSEC
jgi:hypothetical protein